MQRVDVDRVAVAHRFVLKPDEAVRQNLNVEVRYLCVKGRRVHFTSFDVGFACIPGNRYLGLQFLDYGLRSFKLVGLKLQPAPALAFRLIWLFSPSPFFEVVDQSTLHFLEWLYGRPLQFLDW